MGNYWYIGAHLYLLYLRNKKRTYNSDLKSLFDVSKKV